MSEYAYESPMALFAKDEKYDIADSRYHWKIE